MKRLVALLLTLLLALGAMPAIAEEVGKDDLKMIRTAVGMTANMVAKAMDDDLDRAQLVWLKGLAETPFTAPLKAVTVKLTSEQFADMCQNMGADRQDLLRTLAYNTNAQYSEAYAATADALFFTDEITSDDYGYGIKDVGLTLLVYKNDLSLTLSASDIGVQSVFLMGMSSLATDIDGAYIENFAASLGVTDVCYAIYETAEDFKAALYTNTIIDSRWSKAVARSEESMRRMLPQVFKSGYFSDLRVSGMIVSEYLNARSSDPDSGLAAALFIHKVADPIVTEYNTYEDENWRYYCYDEVPWIKPVEYDDLPELAFNEASGSLPSGTVLAVCQVQDKNDNTAYSTYIDYMLESAFPAERIPASAESADLILLMKTEWEEAGKSNSIQLYDAHTAVTLHDAKTGDMIINLGTQIDGLKGVTMVSGDRYHQGVRRGDILNMVNEKLFP